jgi:uncharacterized membrane protein (DUF106 family)
MASINPVGGLPNTFVYAFRFDLPTGLVVVVSVIVGFLMVLVFRYTSDQKAIRIAKDQLKANLLAVRLFQDQLSVVFSSYGRILRGTGRYLRLAFRPLLFVIVPLTILVVQLDHYLGWTGLPEGESFLIKVRVNNPDVLNTANLQLPAELNTTAAPVHIPQDNEVVWRVAANAPGKYAINVGSADKTFSKSVTISKGLERISVARLQGQFWERMLVSTESALPAESPIRSIEVGYPARSISFLGFEWNWIWLFFVLSLAAGFLFKSILGIEI